MTGYKFLELEGLLELHQVAIQRFGGLGGVRDRNLLESALMQPRQQYLYGETDIFALAARYCFGIIKNHPFTDGNKRAGLLAAITFLYNNGVNLECSFEALYTLALRVADSSLKMAEITAFFQQAALKPGHHKGHRHAAP